MAAIPRRIEQEQCSFQCQYGLARPSTHCLAKLPNISPRQNQDAAFWGALASRYSGVSFSWGFRRKSGWWWCISRSLKKHLRLPQVAKMCFIGSIVFSNGASRSVVIKALLVNRFEFNILPGRFTWLCLFRVLIAIEGAWAGIEVSYTLLQLHGAKHPGWLGRCFQTIFLLQHIRRWRHSLFPSNVRFVFLAFRSRRWTWDPAWIQDKKVWE